MNYVGARYCLSDDTSYKFIKPEITTFKKYKVAQDVKHEGTTVQKHEGTTVLR